MTAKVGLTIIGFILLVTIAEALRPTMIIWVAIFTAVVGGEVARVDDLDGPTEFPSQIACAGHAQLVAPKLERYLADATWKAVAVSWRCELKKDQL